MSTRLNTRGSKAKAKAAAAAAKDDDAKDAPKETAKETSKEPKEPTKPKETKEPKEPAKPEEPSPTIKAEVPESSAPDGLEDSEGSEEGGGGECYCGGGRKLGQLELWCATCQKWYHGSCLRQLKDFSALAFMVCYSFSCADCAKEESWQARQANFSHMCITALANITHKFRVKNPAARKDHAFSVTKVIIPYIDENWHWLTSMPRRVKNTWHQTVTRTMLKLTESLTVVDVEEPDVFVASSSGEGEEAEFRLWEEDLSLIGPNNDVIKTVGRRSHQPLAKDEEAKDPDADDARRSQDRVLPPIEGPKTRGAKRKVADQGPPAKKNKSASSDSTVTKYAAHLTIDHPFNRDGYRYYLAEQDMHAPNRAEFESREDMAGKQIPSYFQRVVLPDTLCLSGHDRAPQLRVSDDGLTVTGEKGYSVVRASHGVSHGAWYYEVQFKEQPEGSHVRIGWTTELGNLQAPVGYDKFGYAWRSRKGTRFHDSVGKHYADGGFGQGDVLGCLIELPLPTRHAPLLPPHFKELPVIKFKSQLYFEDKDEPAAAIKAFTPHAGARMTFFKNGVSCGAAFEDFPRGFYFPALSLYKSAALRANFGPRWKARPQTSVAFRAMAERARQVPPEQTLSDLLHFVEKDGKLTL